MQDIRIEKEDKFEMEDIEEVDEHTELRSSGACE